MVSPCLHFGILVIMDFDVKDLSQMKHLDQNPHWALEESKSAILCRQRAGLYTEAHLWDAYMV